MEYRTECVILRDAFVLADHLTGEELVEFLEGNAAELGPFRIRIQREADEAEAKRTIRKLRKFASRKLATWTQISTREKRSAANF